MSVTWCLRKSGPVSPSRRWLCLSLLLTLLPVSYARAQATTSGDVRVERVWARASAGTTANGVVYLTLSNHGERSDRLVALITSIAREAAIHETVQKNGMLSMEERGPLEIRPGESIVLEPSGLHVMLMGLKRKIEEGRSFPLTLTFERAGSIVVDVVVRGVGASGPD